jgi:tRNA(adenine34) deaminase
MLLPQDEYWMRQALQLAHRAIEMNEVPVGAVLVLNNELIGAGHNCPISAHDPTAHAEINALRDGSQKMGNYRLLKSTLYVTLEPCLMCAAAIVHARIQRLVYGAYDPKTGAISSQIKSLTLPWLNHSIDVEGGVLADACGQCLKLFFKGRR